MHSFEDLTYHCTEYMLGTLSESEHKVLQALETSGATSLVKALKMIQLQKAISVVGVFSMFDALLQDRLGMADGFRAANEVLEKAGEADLKTRFQDLQAAINVLKHGRGRYPFRGREGGSVNQPLSGIAQRDQIAEQMV
jgi:hypothetical protein